MNTTSTDINKSQPNHRHQQEEATSELNDIVEKILLNVESRQPMHLGSQNNNHSKLSIQELEQLSLLSSNYHSTQTPNQSTIKLDGNDGVRKYGWATVNIDSLCDLCKLLEDHIRNASRVDYIKFARDAFDEFHDDNGNSLRGRSRHEIKENLEQWSSMTPRKNSSSLQLATILRLGLQAASILISVMITPFIDRRIVSEDTINAAISLMRFHIIRNIIPSISNIGHTAMYAPATANAISSRKGEPSNKKRRKSAQPSNNQTSTKVEKSYQKKLASFLKKAYKPLLTLTIGHLILLMEKIDYLIQSIQVDDQPLLSICSASLSTLTIDTSSNDNTQAHVIQSCAITLVTTVFRQYKRHRIVILEDLFPLFLKLPRGKRSMRTYPVRYLSFHHGQSFNSTGAINTRRSGNHGNGCTTQGSTSSMMIDGEQQGHIQVMTALILFLIQSCITMPMQKSQDTTSSIDTSPSSSDATSDNKKNDRSISSTTSKFSSTGLEQCELICKQLTNFLIQRCSKKGDDGGASEFRPILYHLIDDLLDVQLLPEFPGAEMLLMEICRVLTHVLLSNSSIARDDSSGGSVKKRNGNVEQTYMATCLDAIGTICSDIASKLVVAKENPLQFTKVISSENVLGQSVVEKEVLGCFCGKEKSNVFSLDCDRCHRWFHGNCLRIAKDYTPTHWNCDECKMILLAMKQLGLQFDDEKDLKESERVHIMRIVLLNFISHQLERSQSMSLKDARQFHIAKFVKEYEKIDNTKDHNSLVSYAQYLDMWNIASDNYARSRDISSSSAMSHEYLSEAGNTKVMIALNTSKSQLVANFPRILGVLVALMGDEDVTYLRKGSIKAISQVIQADSSLMSKKMIRDAISKRFKDNAISVREAVVTLVGVYVLQMPDLAKLFHDVLLGRLNDNGISVRKRAIKIFRDLIIINPTYQGRSAVFTTMLQQAANRKEDDGVRDLIHETFQTLWFAAQKNNRKDKALVPSSVNIMGDTCRGAQSGLHETAKQMLDIVIDNPRSQEYLAALVREMLYGSIGGDKEKANSKSRKVDTHNHCSSIVSYLFEELIRFEENRLPNDKEIAGQHLVALLSTIGVFSESAPSLLVKHVDTLLPYLKADNSVSRESESAVVFNLCKILSRVASSLSEGAIQKLGISDLPKDLIRITYVFDSKPTSAAVELIAKFSTYSFGPDNPFMTTLMKLAKIFYKLLLSLKDKVRDFAKITAQQKSNIQRAMSVIGSICQYQSDKEEIPIDEIDEKLIIVEPFELTLSNLPYSCFTVLEDYLEKEDTITKCNALRAMGGIFFSHPRIMLVLEQQGTLKELMSESTHPDLQLETLRCFQAILSSEEQRVESGEASRQMQSKEANTLSKQVSGDQDGDASLIGSCCAEQLPRLFQMMSSSKAEIRESATRLVETLSRQGLLNPMEAIPHLIALQGDLRQPQIRMMSLKLLKILIEMRPGMVRQGFVDGVKQSYFFQCNVYPEENQVVAVLNYAETNGKLVSECIFKDVFEGAIGSSRIHSKRIIKSLLSFFSNQSQLGKNVERKRVIPMMSYIAEILAYLPFNHLGDVLFMLNSISETVALEGNGVMRNLVAFLHSSGLSNVDPDPACVDIIEKAVLKKNPCRTKLLAALNSKKFDTKQFFELCSKACSLSLMVRLYFYLREAYKAVTDKRLAEYDPGEKERINERGAVKTMNLHSFDSQIPNSFSESGAFNKDNLIRQYAIFRSSMRNYDLSFNVQTQEVESGNDETDDQNDDCKRKLSEVESD